MKRMNYTIAGLALMSVACFSSCDKVSPTGVLVGGSGVDDRVDMSYTYYQKYLEDSIDMRTPLNSEGEYSFLVGSDSHLATDKGRIKEMLDIGLSHGDLLWASLGDIADTSADYYKNLLDILDTGKDEWIDKYFKTCVFEEDDEEYDSLRIPYYYDTRYVSDKEDPEFHNLYQSRADIKFPFFSVVGNHDVTRNGWALFTSIFHSSFFEFTVRIGDTGMYDQFIFLDTASGTLGEDQWKLLDDNVLKSDKNIRHIFVFSHSNIFRPRTTQFSSTFPREELYRLLNRFSEWNTTIVFCGHVHAWDDREFGGVRYLTLESMSERNSPDPGDYLVRITCKKDGTVDMERVHMSYVIKK